MKILIRSFPLLFLLVIAGVNGGVRILDARQEAEVLDLWRRYCSSGVTGTHLDASNRAIHCKVATEPIHLESHKSLGPIPGSNQVVFVKPPTYHVTHHLGVSAHGSTLDIFVKPPNLIHEYIQKAAPADSIKPAVSFLKGHGNDLQPPPQWPTPQQPPIKPYPPPRTPPPKYGGYGNGGFAQASNQYQQFYNPYGHQLRRPVRNPNHQDMASLAVPVIYQQSSGRYVLSPPKIN